MPMVGGKHFPYTRAGYKAAAKARASVLRRRSGGGEKHDPGMMPRKHPGADFRGHKRSTGTYV